jgi:hypothetical protein
VAPLPDSVDPKKVLEAIAGNPREPAASRVAACKALLAYASGGRAEKPAEMPVVERATLRVVEMLKRRLNGDAFVGRRRYSD